jgi:2-polyprenyl-3-methyl-5-hydroxy-6-metoxy-1,4-benzoquinol methylase
MSQKSSGLYRLLELPTVYEWFQKALGAGAVRRRFVAEFLRPWPGARLLDIGCGTGALLDDLPDGIEYTGFDVNAAYIDAARRRYGARGHFFCARVGEEATDLGVQPYDFVVAKGLLHHISDEDAHDLLVVARRLLAPNGVFVSSDNVFYDGQPLISRALTALDRGERVRTPHGYRALVSPHFSRLETQLVTDMLAFPYAHFIMRATKT